MKTSFYRTLILVALSIFTLFCSAEEEGLPYAIVKSKELTANVEKSGMSLRGVLEVKKLIGICKENFTGSEVESRETIRSLTIMMLKAKNSSSEEEPVATWQRTIGVFQDASEPNCWADVDEKHKKEVSNEFYSAMATWIKTLRSKEIVGYKSKKVQPPDLPPSLAGKFYTTLPDPSVIPDQKERETYAKKFSEFSANILEASIQQNIGATIAHAEEALATAMLRQPSRGILTRKFFTDMMLKSGASPARTDSLIPKE